MIVVLVIAQYANTANHDYAWDDAIVLTENTRVQKGLSDIPELFENIKTSETQNRYGYRPISLLSFATDVQLFGMNPKAAHRMSIAMYALLCMAIFAFLNIFFPSQGWRNFLITALFVVHPLHTEVVANIKSRDEILAMLFGILGLIAFYKSYKKDNVFFYLLSAVALSLSFLSKESGVVFVGVAVLIPWFYSEGGLRKFSWGTAALAIMAGMVLLGIRAYVYSDWFFQSDDAVLATKGLFHQDGFVGNPLVDYSLSDRIGMAVYLVPFFIAKIFWSYPLLHDYSFNHLEVVTWTDWQVWIAIPFCAVLFGLTIWGLAKRKTYGFGLAFFFITSSVYLHLVQTAPDIFAERFLFAPSLGILICLLSLYQFVAKQRYINLALGLLLIPAFGYTFQRNAVWENNETLIKTDIEKLPNCARANYNVALMLHGEYYEAGGVEQSI
ncbi:MAG: ArnT family glycosyltransferase, partial [Flavobacteriales bacterium]